MMSFQNYFCSFPNPRKRELLMQLSLFIFDLLTGFRENDVQFLENK